MKKYKILEINAETVMIGNDEGKCKYVERAGGLSDPDIELHDEIEEYEKPDGSFAYYVTTTPGFAKTIKKDTPHMVNRSAYLTLAFFVGWLGFHKFYAKHYVAGVLYILLSCLTWVGGAILSIYDMFKAFKTRPDVNDNIIA